MQILGIAYALVSALVAITIPLLLGNAILKPLTQQAKRGRYRVQFTLLDFSCLFLQLQLAMGFVVSYVDRAAGAAFWVVFGLLLLAFTAIWWGGVKALSEAGVRGPGRRAAFILVLLPGAEAVMIAGGVIAVFVMAILASILNRLILGAATLPTSYENRLVESTFLGGAAGIVAIAAVAWFLRWMTAWILQDPRIEDKPDNKP